jgi:hypothetical protein
MLGRESCPTALMLSRSILKQRARLRLSEFPPLTN